MLCTRHELAVCLHGWVQTLSFVHLIFIYCSFIQNLDTWWSKTNIWSIYFNAFFFLKKQNTFFVCVCYVPAPNKGLSYVSLIQKTWYGEGRGNREFFTEIMNRALQGKKLLYWLHLTQRSTQRPRNAIDLYPQVASTIYGIFVLFKVDYNLSATFSNWLS